MLTILMKRQVLTLSVLAAALIAGIRRKDLTVPNEDSSFDSAGKCPYRFQFEGRSVVLSHVKVRGFCCLHRMVFVISLHSFSLFAIGSESLRRSHYRSMDARVSNELKFLLNNVWLL